jgi:prophage DNA circulation protein
MAISWRNDLRPAAFRGIAFETSSRVLNGGRRLVEHAYPQRDGSETEDLGRLPHGIKITAFLFGSDYQVRRDILIDALERSGPGEYTDPWGVHHTVVCKTWTLTETLNQGGYCSFSIDFTQAPARAHHRVVADTGYAVGTAATAASAAAASSFSGGFSLSGVNAYLADATAVVSALYDQLSDMVQSGVGPVGDLLDAAEDLLSSVATLSSVPIDFARRVDGLISQAARLFPTAKARFLILSGLNRFGDTVPSPASSGGVYAPAAASAAAPMPWVPGATPAQVQAAIIAATTGQTLSVSDRLAVNRAVLVRLIQDLAFIEQVRAAAATTYDNAGAALQARDTLAAAIEERLNTADDALFAALMALQTAIVSDLTQRAAQLDQLVFYTPTATVPALVLAYRLYADANQDADIVTRNAIRHPGMIPGGVALSILANGPQRTGPQSNSSQPSGGL